RRELSALPAHGDDARRRGRQDASFAPAPRRISAAPRIEAPTKPPFLSVTTNAAEPAVSATASAIAIPTTSSTPNPRTIGTGATSRPAIEPVISDARSLVTTGTPLTV